MEGTNAKVTLPDRQHSSATPSPRATSTPRKNPLGNNGFHVVYVLQLTVSDDCLRTARVERRLGGYLDETLKPSPPARLPLTGGLLTTP